MSTYPPGDRIRNDTPSSPSSARSSCPKSTPSPSPKGNDSQGLLPHLLELAEEITFGRGTLTEVILDDDDDPVHVVRAMRHLHPTTVVTTYMATGASGWASLAELPGTGPADDADPGTWVVVIDASLLGQADREYGHQYDPETRAFLDGRKDYIDPDTGEVVDVVAPTFTSLPGPACAHPGDLISGPTRTSSRALAAVLWEPMKGIRDVCERTGLRVVVVTSDCRPEHGQGELTKSHFFRDARVRSSLGDAGRHWAHARYSVEGRTVTSWKDELEGRTGPVIYRPHPWSTGKGQGYGRHRRTAENGGIDGGMSPVTDGR